MRNLTIILLTLISVFAFNAFANGQGTPAAGEAGMPVTLIDFQNYAVKALPGVEGVTDADMAMGFWRIYQNAAASDPITMRESYCKDAEKTLGAKVNFPYVSAASHAYIEPKFPIAPFDLGGAKINDNNGVIRNVGMLKEITVDVSSRGYKVGLGVRLKNERNEITEYYLGELAFVGDRTVTWKNPNYNYRVDPKRSTSNPIYPLHDPYLVFDSFVIHRYDGGYGGDFVVYFKNVKVTYDYCIPPAILAAQEKDDTFWKLHANLYDARINAAKECLKEMVRLAGDEKARKGVNFVEDTALPKTGEAPKTETK